jgi:hypothetical protein
VADKQALCLLAWTLPWQQDFWWATLEVAQSTTANRAAAVLRLAAQSLLKTLMNLAQKRSNVLNMRVCEIATVSLLGVHYSSGLTKSCGLWLL